MVIYDAIVIIRIIISTDIVLTYQTFQTFKVLYFFFFFFLISPPHLRLYPPCLQVYCSRYYDAKTMLRFNYTTLVFGYYYHHHYYCHYHYYICTIVIINILLHKQQKNP